MKKLIIIIGVAFCSLFHSCTEYLDVAPESGLSEEDVFTKYANISKYFQGVYSASDNYNITSAHPLNLMGWDQKYGFNATTDIADNGRPMTGQEIKRGILTSDALSQFTTSKYRRPLWVGMFKVIRRCNVTLENLDRVVDAPFPEDLEEIKGQAYFVRAYAHFILASYWGSMPHIVEPIDAYDDWDIPRLSKVETFQAVANDLDSAYTVFESIGKVRRDAAPGLDGNLSDPLQGKPAGMAAKALKARALLYAASPLNNETGDKTLYEAAAIAASDAIKLAEEYKYILLPMDEYNTNFNTQSYSNEQIWAYPCGSKYYGYQSTWGILGGIFCNSTGYGSGEMPTQNMVDMYETADGDALNTEADRAAAIAAGHYNEQDPYTNRDARFYNNVIYNQSPLQWNYTLPSGETKHHANIYYTVNSDGSLTYSSLLKQNFKGVTHTGYYVKKVTKDMSYGNNYWLSLTDPIIRLAELYLNYAEAASEAYGPNGSAPGATYTAVEALNKIRNRAELPDIASKYTSSIEAFRPRVQNERTVEFDQEGFHRFFDIRRWKIAPQVMTQRLTCVNIEKLDAPTDEYPTGFKYMRGELSDDRQPVWRECMYYFPLPTSEYFKFKDFDTSLNPVW